MFFGSLYGGYFPTCDMMIVIIYFTFCVVDGITLASMGVVYFHCFLFMPCFV